MLGVDADFTVGNEKVLCQNGYVISLPIKTENLETRKIQDLGKEACTSTPRGKKWRFF